MKIINTAFLLSIILLTISCKKQDEKHRRTTISLNGTWKIAQTSDTLPPVEFNRTIPVPGLLDMAKPAFDSTGYKSSKRKYFWYKKVVKVDVKESGLAYLKVHKAKFGHAVYVNGHYAGKNNFCFTPGYFEVKEFLKYGKVNEILIRVGADTSALPDTIPFGNDWEKAVFYPGVYDGVELFMADYPYIKYIQTIPDIQNGNVGIAVWIQNDKTPREFKATYVIKEKDSREPVVIGQTNLLNVDVDEIYPFEFELNIPGCHLWSPEDPFLYELVLSTPGDSKTITFGMREFCFDTATKQAMLNGEPYYLRGTNVALHRFLEDTVRNDLPWKREWIEKMHDEFKDMHWNAYRFHVGFAPEVWYEAADEKGLLVQDEYAIWGLDMINDDRLGLSDPKRHKASVLAVEYKRWMKERWNHPCVVIWDAQNETLIKETGKAIGMVRHYDLSDRPWDNGFSAPQQPGDVIETHPYLLGWPEKTLSEIDPMTAFSIQKNMPEGGLLKRELAYEPEPFNGPNSYDPPAPGKKHPNPVIVNEYGWIWLYRDGSPSNEAKPIWALYPELDTPEKRWDWRGRFIAAMTEYWRSKREIAGVMHFCALTCDRPWGKKPSQVSDEWKDVPNLVIHPGFKKYVKPAFSPVGIMIKKWDNSYQPGEKIKVPVILVNDLNKDWEGEVTFKILKGEEEVFAENRAAQVESIGKNELVFIIYMPSEKGAYEMIAEIDVMDEKVFSTRLFEIE